MSLLTVLFTFPQHLDLVIRSLTENKEIRKAFLRVSERFELLRVSSSYRGLNYRKCMKEIQGGNRLLVGV